MAQRQRGVSEREREVWVDYYKNYFFEYLSSRQEIAELYQPEDLKLFAEMAGEFVYGVSLVDRRMKDNAYKHEIGWRTKEQPRDLGEGFEAGGVGYLRETEEYVFLLSDMASVINRWKRDLDKKVYVHAGGIDTKVSLRDKYLFGGVEEAAHRFYFRSNPSEAVPVNRHGIEYFVPEVEYRALVWKKAVAQRYFPEYYPSLKDTYEAASYLRTNVPPKSK